MNQSLDLNEKLFWRLLLASVVVYVFYMTLDVMQVDAAQYASMSLQMLQSGEYLEVKGRGADYLDKPPLVFWLSSLSFEIFGVGNFQFKLPSVLALFLGLFSSFKIARMFYSRQVAFFTAIALATSEAFFFTTNDVRTDNLLIGFSTFSIWQILRYIQKPSFASAILAGIGVGFGMLAKGPLGLVFPMLAVGPHLLYRRELKTILNVKWLIALPVVGLVLLPMCIGLYNQFGTRGLYFFFWEQSFGRITGENVWKNDTDPFFMLHSFAWAILPWTFIFVLSFFRQANIVFKSRFKSNVELPELIGLSGYLLSTIALSQSEYKLPHYIFVAIPSGALMVGGYLEKLFEKQTKWIFNTVHVMNILSFSFAIFLSSLWVEETFGIFLVGLIVLVFGFVYFKLRREKVVWLLALTGIGVNILLCNWFFKPILTYQTTSTVAREIKEMGEEERFVSYKAWGFALDFYTETIVPYPTMPNQLIAEVEKRDTFFLYTPEVELSKFDSLFEFEKINEYDNFIVSRLKPKFLNPSTRDSATQKRILVKAYKK